MLCFFLLQSLSVFLFFSVHINKPRRLNKFGVLLEQIIMRCILTELFLVFDVIICIFEKQYM